MAAIAKLADFPHRKFSSRYWDMPGGPTIYAYVSDETKPMMIAIDLHDVPANTTLDTVSARMRAGDGPFRSSQEVCAGVHGRFLVAEVAI